MALLQVHDLHAHYGAIQALRGVSFTVEVGQVVCLIGANGAGKSTTLNAISGLIAATSGTITFDGVPIQHWRANQITAAGLVQVPEGRQVIAPMSVQENLHLGAQVNRIPRAERGQAIRAIFDRFPRLAERRDQKAGSLSGGEQQMLAIGRALMARPRLLMLDEPSMGLAPLLVAEVFRLIAQIAADGTPILLVEQNARKALDISHYAYVMERGAIVQAGTANLLAHNEQIIEAYLG
ncbi:MAG: ABC transporter ATP-binding protein [Phototrophicaceae bacterium]